MSWLDTNEWAVRVYILLNVGCFLFGPAFGAAYAYHVFSLSPLSILHAIVGFVAITVVSTILIRMASNVFGYYTGVVQGPFENND